MPGPDASGDNGSGAASTSGPTTVVIVDDDPDFRDLATRLVRSWGYDVVGEAGSVAGAMACVAALQPHTVLADIGLPDGNGFTLTRDLVRLPHAPTVVLISSDTDPSNHGAAARVGARAFVPKHALVRELRAVMAAGD
jgi:DNA-binding NarL/FixJ family response regulator